MFLPFAELHAVKCIPTSPHVVLFHPGDAYSVSAGARILSASMLPILQRRFRALEDSKAMMLNQLSTIAPARLSERPPSGEWSAGELVSHIAGVERSTLQAVQQKLKEDESSVRLRDRVGSLIVRNVMRSPLRSMLPVETLSVQPQEHSSASDALSDWQHVRDEWRELLEHARGPQLKAAVFSHPKSGWFTLPETVLFLRLHHDRHRAQMARIAKALASREPVFVA